MNSLSTFSGEVDSPMLEAFHVIPQSGSQVTDAHLLLLQGGEVLLGGRDPDPMVVAAGRVFGLTP